jgi:hypothetical protein
MVEGQGVPLGDHLHATSPSEVKLVQATLKMIRVGRWHRAGRPRHKLRGLIADRGYDSDPLREQLTAGGIELIAPHRKNRPRSRATPENRPSAAHAGASSSGGKVAHCAFPGKNFRRR